MCWTSANKPVKQIAKEDVICYKIVISRDGRVVSPYFHYEYKYHKINEEIALNIEYTLSSDINQLRLYKCRQGYHSYSSLDFANQVYNNYFYENDGCVFKCIIPKGSVYYDNKHGEIVSSNIIIGINQKEIQL